MLVISRDVRVSKKCVGVREVIFNKSVSKENIYVKEINWNVEKSCGELVSS